MTPQKVYSLDELRTIRLKKGDTEIMRIFLSPGMAFQAPHYNCHWTPHILTTKQKKSHDLDMMQANIYNAFADYIPTHGIPVQPIYGTKSILWFPEVFRNAALSQCAYPFPRFEGNDTNPSEILPFLGKEGVDNSELNTRLLQAGMYLTEIENFGMDVKSLAATLGDALAMIIFKCGLLYRGKLAFIVLSSESPGCFTIGLSVYVAQLFDKQRPGDARLERKDMTRMAEAAEAQLPSPRVLPLLWNIFKTAFITRGKKYHSLVRDMTPEEMMAFFEGAYNS